MQFVCSPNMGPPHANSYRLTCIDSKFELTKRSLRLCDTVQDCPWKNLRAALVRHDSSQWHAMAGRCKQE